MSDSISRQAAIDALDVLCQEYRYRIPGKRETYSQYNEAWQDALDRAERSIFNLPSAQPEIIRCKDCKHHKVYEIKGHTLMLCNRLRTMMADSLEDIDYCSRAERKEDD